MSLSHLLTLTLILVMALSFPVMAQQPSAARAAATPPQPGRRPAPGGLRILVLEGQGASNSIRSRSAISPVVQVLDALDQPVEGASVTFEAPPSGPGGSFDTGPVATVETDVNGQATTPFAPNKIPGDFSIKVTASYLEQSASAILRQTNDGRIDEAMLPLPSPPWYKKPKWWAILGAGAGAGVAAAILANRNGTPTITIMPGSAGIGGPR